VTPVPGDEAPIATSVRAILSTVALLQMRCEKSILPLSSEQNHKLPPRLSPPYLKHTGSHEETLTDKRATDDACPTYQ
jgi:hypothetical protein